MRKSLLQSRNTGLVLGVLLMLLMIFLFTPQFYNGAILTSMIRNNCVYFFLSMAEMIIIMSGNIDLSGPAVLAISGCMTTVLHIRYPGIPMFVLLVIAIAIGMCCGIFSGFVVHYMNITPMIATLGTSYIIRGVTFFLTEHGREYQPSMFSKIFRSVTIHKTLGVFDIIWYAVILLALSVVFLNKMAIGRRLLAIGSNKESAFIAGVNVRKIGLIGYVIAGGVCGFAGMLYASNYGICSCRIADGYEMTAIATCILGGVTITGGEAGISGMFLSFLIMSLITSFISMLPGMSIWQSAIQGTIIILALLLNVFIAKMRIQREMQERGQRI